MRTIFATLLSTLPLILAVGCDVDDVCRAARDHVAQCTGAASPAATEATCEVEAAESVLDLSCEQLQPPRQTSSFGPALAAAAKQALCKLGVDKYCYHICAQAQSYVQRCMAGGGAWDLVECTAAQRETAQWVMLQKVCPWDAGEAPKRDDLDHALVSIGFWMRGLPHP